MKIFPITTLQLKGKTMRTMAGLIALFALSLLALMGCATLNDTFENLPFRRSSHLENGFKSLEVGLTKEQALAHLSSFFPKGSPPLYNEEESVLADEVLSFGAYKMYLKKGRVWFSTSAYSNRATFSVVANANSEFETKRVFIKPFKRDNMETNENDPVFKRLKLLFISSMTEADLEVVNSEAAADTIVLLEWAASNEQFDYDVEVPIYNSTYIPGSQTTTNYYSPYSGYVGQSSSYTPGRSITTYAGSRTVKRTEYYDFYKLTATGFRNVRSKTPEYFSVKIGVTDYSRKADYDDIVTRLFAYSIPYWGENVSPVKTVKLPFAYPPHAILNEG